MKYVPISAFILYLIMLFAIRKEIGDDLKRTGELVDIKRNKLYFILIFIANINLLVVDLVRPVPGYLNRNIMKYPGIFLYVYGILLTIYVVATIKDSMRGPNADKMKEFDGEDAYTINRNPLYKALMLITAGHLVTTTRLSFIFLFIVTVLLVISQTLKEERALQTRYGKKYLRYKNKIKRF